MPAKVVEPNGNQLNNNEKNCGYLERADKPLDDQDTLERIPFINDFNLEYGDLVVYETMPNCNVEVNGKKGKIAMAVVKHNPNDAKTWENKEFKNKWAEEWSRVTNNKIIYRLKLKDGVTPEILSKVKDKKEYEDKRQKKYK